MSIIIYEKNYFQWNSRMALFYSFADLFSICLNSQLDSGAMSLIMKLLENSTVHLGENEREKANNVWVLWKGLLVAWIP